MEDKINDASLEEDTFDRDVDDIFDD